MYQDTSYQLFHPIVQATFSVILDGFYFTGDTTQRKKKKNATGTDNRSVLAGNLKNIAVSLVADEAGAPTRQL